jgi:glycine cleavage system H protein
MNYPQHLQYTRGHQWLSIDGSYAFMGITDFAQKELGRIVTVTIPYLNKIVKSEKFVGSIEADQTVLDIFMPVTGTIVGINPDILKKPGLVNLAPYHTWILKIVATLPNDEKPLLTIDEYTAFVWQLSKTKKHG